MFTTFISFPLKVAILGLVLVSAAFLLVSIFVSRDVQAKVPPRFVLRWRILTGLIGFFFFCYLGYIVVRLSDFPFPLELLTAIVFFCGSLFVYGTIDLSRNSIAQLHEVNENLEKIVDGRTAELSEANDKLEKSMDKYAKQSKFLESALDALTHPFYVVDAESYEVILSNKASGFAGRSASTCHQLTHGSDLPCNGPDHPCPLREIKETGKPVIVEHVHRDVAGNAGFVEFHGNPIFDGNGKVIHMIEYFHDITGRKMTEMALIKANQEAVEKGVSLPSGFPPWKILIVDDISPNRDLLRLILERADHLVEEVGTDLEALHLLAEKEYDAVLLAVRMPVLEGEQTAAVLRQSEKGLIPEGLGIDVQLAAKLLARHVGRHTPIIALTGQAMDIDRERLLRAGIDGYIGKPFHVEEVLRQLTKIYKSIH